MEFRDSYRMEAIYFQTLKEEISRVKALMASGNTEQAKTLLENAVNVDGAVLLLYRNLGELWAELGAKIEEAKKELEKLDSRVDDYHRELNEKIDDVNNTIIRLINALEERVRALEECCEEVQEALENKQDKLTPGIGIAIDENNVIKNTILKLDESDAISKSEYTVNVTKIDFNPSGIMAKGFEIAIEFNKVGNELKDLLSDYNGIFVAFNITKKASLDLRQFLLSDGEYIEYDLSLIDCKSLQIVPYSAKLKMFMVRLDSTTDAVDTVSGNYICFGLKNFLETISATGKLTIKFNVGVRLNGKFLPTNSPIVDINNYSINITIRGRK